MSSKSKSRWEVYVGNVGLVYDGTNGFAAYVCYGRYKKIVISGVGRAGHESVVLMRDGEPVTEYHHKFDAEGLCEVDDG